MTKNTAGGAVLPEFQKEQIYVRREIHERYGGQGQGGISTPKNTPAIFIFTGAAGKEHGYGYDGWVDTTTFHYTGEGQPDSGHQRFVRGNKAIRDHRENNKHVYLFETLPKRGETRGKVRFKGELELIDYEIREQDSTGIPRKVIVFRFRRVD